MAAIGKSIDTSVTLDFKTEIEKDKFSSISNEVDAVIQTFIREYELHHRVIILYHKLEKTLTGERSYFTSEILRLNFSFQKGDETFSSSVLLKIPQLGPVYDYGIKMLFYQKEKYMYEKVILLMYENVPYENPSPKFYGSTQSGILVLENLRKSAEFYTMKRGSQLDLAASKVVLKSLAQFHALSTLHLDKISTELDSLTVSDRGESEWATKIFPPIVKKVRKHVLPLCSRSTCTTFDDFVNNVRFVIKLGFSGSEKGLNTILHGDAHCYNMLFQDDLKHNVTKCKFVDFQGSRRGSPVVDLGYFFVTSVQFEVFDKHREVLYDYYLREFKSTLEQLDIPNRNHYSLDDLHADFQTYKLFFLYVLIAAVPVFWAGECKTESKNDDENALDAVINSEKYISYFKGWVKYLL